MSIKEKHGTINRGDIMLDKDIREPLFEYIESTCEKVRIFEEIKIRSSIADVMVVTDNKVTGVEIKSDGDTYARLPSQIKDYNHFFDYNYIAVGVRHIKSIEKHIPAFWGIICISEENGIVKTEKIREGMQNPRAKEKYLIKLLWRLELNNILDNNHLPKYRQKSKEFVKKKICEKLPPQKLKEEICRELFERDYTLLY